MLRRGVVLERGFFAPGVASSCSLLFRLAVLGGLRLSEGRRSSGGWLPINRQAHHVHLAWIMISASTLFFGAVVMDTFFFIKKFDLHLQTITEI